MPPAVFLLLALLSAGTILSGGDKTLLPARRTDGLPTGAPLNINNLVVWASDDGMLERRPSDLSGGVIYPRGTAAVIHASGLLWGGLVNDGSGPSLRVGGQSYSQGTVPGRIIRPGIAEDPANASVRIYRIRRDWATADLRQDAADTYGMQAFDVTQADINRLREQYRRDWNEWPWQNGAPFTDRNGVPGYQPDSTGTDTVNSDIPGIEGADQVIWFVTNDLDPAVTARLYGSPPIGLELQVTCWAYASVPALANTVFERFRIIYKGTTTTPSTASIDQMYLAKWSDPDIGDYSDDLVGCSAYRAFSYAYNSTPHDAEFDKFNAVPPVVGYRLLQGPRVPEAGSTAHWDLNIVDNYKNLPLGVFTYFEPYTRNSDYDLGSYTGTQEWYNIFRGYNARPVSAPACLSQPGSGICSPIECTGDPRTYHGWIDGIQFAANDRRMAMVSGPFSLAYGDTQEVVFTLVAATGTDNRSGITAAEQISDDAHDAFVLNFKSPNAVPAPNVRVVELDGKLLLEWESDTTRQGKVERYSSLGYRFETYTIYQLDGPDPATAHSVVYSYFDQTQPRYLVLTRDALRNKPLVNGQEYYFAVTTTAFNPDVAVIRQRISSPVVVHTCTPHQPNPGMVYPYGIGGEIDGSWSIVGAADAMMVPTYFDPSRADGHLYKVRFTRGSDPFRDQYNKPTWTLIDSTTVDTLASSKADQPPVRIITRGFTFQVLSPRRGLRGVFETTAGGHATNDSVFNRPNRGGNYMVMAAGLSDLDTIKGFAYTDIDIELRFTGDSSWGLIRESTAGLSRWVRLPFTAWQVGKIGRDTVNKQTYAIITNASGDSLMRPRLTMPDPRDDNHMVHSFYPISVMGDSLRVGNTWYCGTYDDSAPYRADWRTTRAVLYTVGSIYNDKLSIRMAYIADMDGDGQIAPVGTTIRFARFKAVRNGDEKLFRSLSVDTNNLDAARRAVELVNVFPNPYYGMNRAEQSRFDHFVTFSHLPHVATIRVFNLAGVLVRTIRKDSPEQFVRWDLTNENGLLAAAGLYLAHCEMRDAGGRDLGTKILKLIIVPPDASPGKN